MTTRQVLAMLLLGLLGIAACESLGYQDKPAATLGGWASSDTDGDWSNKRSSGRGGSFNQDGSSGVFLALTALPLAPSKTSGRPTEGYRALVAVRQLADELLKRDAEQAEVNAAILKLLESDETGHEHSAGGIPGLEGLIPGGLGAMEISQLVQYLLIMVVLGKLFGVGPFKQKDDDATTA